MSKAENQYAYCGKASSGAMLTMKEQLRIIRRECASMYSSFDSMLEINR